MPIRSALTRDLLAWLEAGRLAADYPGYGRMTPREVCAAIGWIPFPA